MKRKIPTNLKGATGTSMQVHTGWRVPKNYHKLKREDMIESLIKFGFRFFDLAGKKKYELYQMTQRFCNVRYQTKDDRKRAREKKSKPYSPRV